MLPGGDWPAVAEGRLVLLDSLGARSCPWVSCLERSLAFELGIEFTADEDSQAREIEPKNENGDAGKGAVGLAIRAETGYVERKAQGSGKEHNRSEDSPHADPLPPRLFSIRTHEIEE